MSDEQPHGVQADQVVKSRYFLRDTRHPTQRFWEAGKKPANLGVACFVMAGLIMVYPALADVGLLLALLIALRAKTIKPSLPIKLPDHYKGIDKHDPVPGDRGKYHRARAAFFLGNERQSLKELWFALTDVLTHFLVIGGTGAGKTEALLSMASNTLIWGSGFTYTDGKGDSALWTKAFALLRACGREDDLYVINYMTASRTIDPEAPVADRLSNQFNPYMAGSADALIQLTSSLLSEASGDSATWREKALGLLTAVAQVAYALRERGLDECGEPFVLDVASFRRYFTLDTLIDVFLRAQHRVDDFTLNVTALNTLQHYLESVPGYQDPERLWSQSADTRERPFDAPVILNKDYPTQPEPQAYIQHGYLQNQFTRIFGQLSDVYGHIYRCHYGEVDFQDIVINRRVLIVMLPALEKSPDELASLGKIIIAAKKTMLAVGLGSRLEGTHREVIDNKPIHSPSPFLDLNDEYGYYAVKGFAVVPAQARSLGFSVVFGGQDTPSFGKESKEEAQAVFGNTLIKLAMKIEDAGESFELFQKTAGEALVTQTSGFTRHDNAWMSNYYHDNASASVERRNRIDLRDIRDQGEGQAHLFFGSKIVRSNLFFAELPTAQEYRINRFIQVLPLTDNQVEETQQALTSQALRAGVLRILRIPNPLLELMHSEHHPVVNNQHRECNHTGIEGVIKGVLAGYEQRDTETATAINRAFIGGSTHTDTEHAVGGGTVPRESPDVAQPDPAQPDVDLLLTLEENDVLMTGLCTEYDAGDEPAPEDVAPDTVFDADVVLNLAEEPAVLVSRLSQLGEADRFMQGAALSRILQGQLPASVASELWPPPTGEEGDEEKDHPTPPPAMTPSLDDLKTCETHWHGVTQRSDTQAQLTCQRVTQNTTPLAGRPVRGSPTHYSTFLGEEDETSRPSSRADSASD